MEGLVVSAGNSKMSLTKSTTGKYGFDISLVFVGNNMRIIKRMIDNICKARLLLEEAICAPVIPTEETVKLLEKLGQMTAAAKEPTTEE
jgi:hypothetical protein